MQNIELIPIDELAMAKGGGPKDVGWSLLASLIYDGVKYLHNNRNNYNGAEIIYPALGT